MSHGLSVCCFLPRPAPSLRPPPRSRSAPSPQPAEGGTEPFLFLISASPGHQRLLASRLGALPGPLTEVPARTHMVQAPFQSSTPSYQQVRGCTSPFPLAPLKRPLSSLCSTHRPQYLCPWPSPSFLCSARIPIPHPPAWPRTRPQGTEAEPEGDTRPKALPQGKE